MNKVDLHSASLTLFVNGSLMPPGGVLQYPCDIILYMYFNIYSILPRLEYAIHQGHGGKELVNCTVWVLHVLDSPLVV